MRILMLAPILCILIQCSTKKEEVATYRNYMASLSPDGTEALFYSDRNGNWDIYKIGTDGNNLTQITNTAANETEPNWHPVRSEFAFASDESGERKIYLYNLETNTKNQLVFPEGKHSSPVWSNDGTRLAFLNQLGEQWEVLAMKVGDTTTIRLYNGATYPGRPAWTHQNEVLYSVMHEGKETLHLVDMEGNITERIITGYNSVGNAAISPDGSQIIFDAHSEDVLDSGDGKWEIFVMNRRDQSIVRLTENENDDWGARWSRDGSKILYLGLGLNNTGYELHVMNADGSGKLQLTDKTK